MFFNKQKYKIRKRFGSIVLMYRDVIYVIQLLKLFKVEVVSAKEGEYELFGYYTNQRSEVTSKLLVQSEHLDELEQIQRDIFQSLGWSFSWVKKTAWVVGGVILATGFLSMFSFPPDQQTANSKTPMSLNSSNAGTGRKTAANDLEKAKADLKASLMAQAGNVQDFTPSTYKFNPQITPLAVAPPELKCATQAKEQIKN